MPQLLITWRVKGLDAAAQSVNNNGRCPCFYYLPCRNNPYPSLSDIKKKQVLLKSLLFYFLFCRKNVILDDISKYVTLVTNMLQED